MNERLHTINTSHLNTLTQQTIQENVSNLESGQVLYFPHYTFTPNTAEQRVIFEPILHPKHKNINYHYCSKDKRHLVAGLCSSLTTEQSALMSNFMQRFSTYAEQLVKTTLPQYSNALILGRTSYRPAEIKNRKTSPRKDDTRVHVDSFSASPVNGLRILRVFCNINPFGAPRSWELGEPFGAVLHHFAPTIPAYSRLRAKLLQWVKTTKTFRSPYDHYMIYMHDKMKRSNHYQRTVNKQRVDFPPHSSWIVFTDHVSHAALSGQYLLEQTFYLPVAAMKHPEFSPLKQWESHIGKVLTL